MCQIDLTYIETDHVIAYRVFKTDTDTDGQLISYYNDKPFPGLNQRTEAWDFPFHAFLSEMDVVRWIKSQSEHHYKYFYIADQLQDTSLRREYNKLLERISIFKVKLEKDLKSGVWDCDNTVNTVTGNVCTILEEMKDKKQYEYPTSE